jgi:hypothetical protein
MPAPPQSLRQLHSPLQRAGPQSLVPRSRRAYQLGLVGWAPAVDNAPDARPICMNRLVRRPGTEGLARLLGSASPSTAWQAGPRCRAAPAMRACSAEVPGEHGIEQVERRFADTRGDGVRRSQAGGGRPGLQCTAQEGKQEVTLQRGPAPLVVVPAAQQGRAAHASHAWDGCGDAH